MHNKPSKKLICTKPFEWFEATNDEVGYPVYLCCPGWMPKSVGDLSQNAPAEIWHGDKAQEIRRSVLDGSFKYCNREFCPHLSSLSGPVKNVDTEVYNSYQAKLSGEVFWPKNLNCSYDRSCNLQCPSCRSEIEMAKGKQRNEINVIGNNLLDAFGDSIESLYITGSGDPFSSKHFLHLLTSGILKKYSNLKLYLHSNAQLLTREVWEKLNLANEQIAVLEVSIDAASMNTYEENRRPGKWHTLLTNMTFLSELKKQGLIEQFKISFVVQLNNYTEMPKFISLGKFWGVDLIYFSTLNNWGTYSEDEYLRRAIHKPEHLAHTQLLDILEQIDRSDALIELGYFNGLLKN